MTMNRLARFTALSAASAALAFGGVGIAQADRGADDPPGHDVNDDRGGKHHSGNDDRGGKHHGGKHHGGNDDRGGKDDHGHHGPNHD